MGTENNIIQFKKKYEQKQVDVVCGTSSTPKEKCEKLKDKIVKCIGQYQLYLCELALLEKSEDIKEYLRFKAEFGEDNLFSRLASVTYYNEILADLKKEEELYQIYKSAYLEYKAQNCDHPLWYDLSPNEDSPWKSCKCLVCSTNKLLSPTDYDGKLIQTEGIQFEDLHNTIVRAENEGQEEEVQKELYQKFSI